ncbi:MAG: 5-formyltetrahydrofolate cyclo-ligase [Nitrosopumilaceae archaeon]
MSLVEKARLRRQLLDARDSLSQDFIDITSKQIQENLRKVNFFRSAKSVGCYYSIGSEVRTQDILHEILNSGKELSLPKVVKHDIVFKKIIGLSDLEKGNFSVMEPKEDCAIVKNIDVIIVPAIALSREGYRLGYGFGYYDRYLSGKKSKTIALTYSKQLVKSFPHSSHDVRIDCIVTEDEVTTSKIR